MTGLDRNQTPKTRPMAKRTALAASLDIGTSKIACMIARLKPCPPNEALRGRSHAVELIGYSQIQSRGVKAGAVVDLVECEQAVRHAVALAERMAKVRVESVLLSASAGRRQGHSRSARHGGPAIRRRHERRHRGCNGGPEPDAGGRTLPSQRRSHGGEPLCGESFGLDRR